MYAYDSLKDCRKRLVFSVYASILSKISSFFFFFTSTYIRTNELKYVRRGTDSYDFRAALV